MSFDFFEFQSFMHRSEKILMIIISIKKISRYSVRFNLVDTNDSMNTWKLTLGTLRMRTKKGLCLGPTGSHACNVA